MANKKNIKIGDYVRWLYPLGYVDSQKRRYAQGLITQMKGDDSRLDGVTMCILDSSYHQLFWLSLDLLIDFGQLQVLNNGTWEDVRKA